MQITADAQFGVYRHGLPREYLLNDSSASRSGQESSDLQRRVFIEQELTEGTARAAGEVTALDATERVTAPAYIEN